VTGLPTIFDTSVLLQALDDNVFAREVLDRFCLADHDADGLELATREPPDLGYGELPMPLAGTRCCDTGAMKPVWPRSLS
jgi:hypothetical protein